MKFLFVMLILLTLKMSSEAVEPGATAPQWDVPSAVRGTFHSTFYAGKVLVLNFWDTRCGACRTEMPALAGLYNDLHPRGLEIVGIAVHETTTSVAAFLKEVPVPYGIGLSTDQILGDFNIQFVPTTIVIDQANKVAAVHLGFTDDSVLRDEVLRLLNASNSGPTITVQPASEVVRLGAPFAFSVSVSGSDPFQFQWFRQGQPVTGATSTVFAANAASMNDIGRYSVSVSNSFGFVVSDTVTLSVDPSIQAPKNVTINLTNQNEILLNWSENDGPLTFFP